MRTATVSSKSRRLLAVAALTAAVALAIALWTQAALDMQPCSWCVAQRMAIIVAGVAAAAGAAVSRRGPRNLCAAVVVVAALVGLAAAVWQQGWAAQTLACPLTLVDRLLMATELDQALPFLFKASASCSEANRPLFGVPYAVLSGLCFALLATLAGLALRASRRQSWLRP